MTTYLNSLGLICALGDDQQSVKQGLANHSAEYLTQDSAYHVTEQAFFLGKAPQLPELTDFPAYQRTRNNALAYTALKQIEGEFQALSKNIAKERIAVIIGSSTSGIAEGETAAQCKLETGEFPDDYDYACQELYAPAQFIADYLGITGPTYTISTACSSSAKALHSASMMLEQGLVDMVICGGVDSLCKLTVSGFDALESMSQEKCQPFAQHRDGINIGEAAALFIMSTQTAAIALLGAGESSDAYHISAPDPSGAGAIRAMKAAMKAARCVSEDIGYINLHGTGTEKNDEMEARAVYEMFADQVPASSTKRLTGHTLGAAGALEAALCWLLLDSPEMSLPIHELVAARDDALAPIQLVSEASKLNTPICMSNSFAFGGNNMSLILGRVDAV